MGRPYVDDIATSTTASSTTFPEGFHLLSVTNLSSTGGETIQISFTEAIDTNSAGAATLGVTDATRGMVFNNIQNILETETIYWDAGSGTPTLRVIGFIA